MLTRTKQVVHPCPECETAAAVVPVHLFGVDPEVQYFTCNKCHIVYGVRLSEDGPGGSDLRSVFADTGHRNRHDTT